MYFAEFCVFKWWYGYGIEGIVVFKCMELQLIWSIQDDQSPSNKTKILKLIKNYELNYQAYISCQRFWMNENIKEWAF
jgi:hypothetical protein